MKFFIISFLIFLSNFFLNPSLAYNFIEDSGLSETAGQAGYDLSPEDDTLERIITRNITLVLSLVGVIFIILIIYAGINWMTASGSEEKVNKAKKIITNSIIGLIIVIAAYAISYFIVAQILATGVIQIYDVQ